ncbi:hypothetical protein [Phenylobacterium montanum]|uniref:Uncharacterized protein n=1 Tax=Phenylobacterium montanum TaxID=2823693 RepID=A0A975IZ02_9CAUL|nr:hypothetical protein [Caulobacter sp. S6]QUD90976.1 hypothetical protein KCG34_25415 [Caulobacter sp. S6]
MPGLEAKALETLRKRAPCPVATYRTILRSIAADDLESEGAEPTRRRFNAYYGVRRNAAWRMSFYARFEAAKHSTRSASELFEDVVEGIRADTGRIEASFASKLVATLRPNSPVIDSVVRAWLSLHTEPPRFASQTATVVTYYRWLEAVMLETAASAGARRWSAAFEEAFPSPAGEHAISDLKRLDFLIWAGADR